MNTQELEQLAAEATTQEILQRGWQGSSDKAYASAVVGLTMYQAGFRKALELVRQASKKQGYEASVQVNTLLQQFSELL